MGTNAFESGEGEHGTKRLILISLCTTHHLSLRSFWDNTAVYAVAVLAIAALQAVQPATMDASTGGVVPFSPQDLWWAVRDGYTGDLASHLFHKGGLVADDAVATVVSSLSPQKLVWSGGCVLAAHPKGEKAAVEEQNVNSYIGCKKRD